MRQPPSGHAAWNATALDLPQDGAAPGGSANLRLANPGLETKPFILHDCLCWLHETSCGGGADVAVLLCHAFREDAVMAHRHFRLLGQSLARAGYPTLRFDYPGTGDSCDLEGGAEPLTAWVQSVHRMADWLREASGARGLILCGLGFGATLAAIVASQRADVAAVVLFAPLARGQSLVRQIEFEARLAGISPTGVRHAMDGRFLPEATVSAIRSIDLRQLSLPAACAVAVFSKGASKALEEVAEAWRRGHALVTWANFDGLEPLQRPEFLCHEPPADFNGVAQWLSRTAPATPLLKQSPPTSTILRGPNFEERPFQFGPSGRLFGILCCPSGPISDVAVLIVNSSANPRYGHARGTVQMARQYAAAGVSSFRIDLAGVGDSRAPNDAETHVFLTDRQPDIAAAIDFLADRGYRSVAVQGVCSGAYHAFHAATADPRISTLLLVNLPLFEWQADVPIEQFQPHRRSQLYYISLKGELGIAARLRIHSAKIAAYAVRLLPRRRPPNRGRSFAQSAAKTLADRGTRTLLIMAPDENGLVVLRSEFGPSRTPPGATLHVSEQINHGLTTAAMRAYVSEMALKFLKAEQPY